MKRLGQEVARALLHGLDHGRGCPVGRDHDHGRPRAGLPDSLQDDEAVFARHHDIEYNQVEGIGLQKTARGGRATPKTLLGGIAVQANQTVERGAKLMTLEAMKMQSNIYAPIAGKITKLLVTPGQHVEAKDLLVSIAP
jgi:acetyl/propionyl-CoA carboxylase alpha subunit